MDDEPCSNDVGGQPCPGGGAGIFEDAADVEDRTTETSSSSSSFYSCVAPTEGELAYAAEWDEGEGGRYVVSSTVGFAYEVHVETASDLRSVLDEFELRLAHGVALELGLVDGEDGGCTLDLTLDGVVGSSNDGELLGLGGGRRRGVAVAAAAAADMPSVAAISSRPADVVDDESREFEYEPFVLRLVHRNTHRMNQKEKISQLLSPLAGCSPRGPLPSSSPSTSQRLARRRSMPRARPSQGP
jgi:hypothetical protein